MPQTPLTPMSQEWAVLFYLCGHFNREKARDPFLTALEELREIGASAEMSAAAYLDLESGAQRVALRPGEPVETEFIGPVNSGAAATLEQFLTWAFDACPARRYILVMAGLGILDADSVVGRPPFDSTRTFAICDDRATGDALELHELGETLRTSFPREGSRRLVLLACDMYAMQFMEVAYELRGMLDLLVGIQPDERDDAGALVHWPYSRLMQRWQEVVAAPASGPPRWRTGVDPVGVKLASETIALLAGHYTRAGHDPVTVSAINLQALVPLAQALDTFSVVYLQWLSNDVVWRAREHVVRVHQRALEHSWSYDLDEVAKAICAALDHAADEALARWAASAVPAMPYAQLSRTLRVLGASAREQARAEEGAAFQALADEIAACRSLVERVTGGSSEAVTGNAPPPQHEADHAVRRLFAAPEGDDAVRAPQAWHAIIAAARDRFTAAPARELSDAFDGIEAAKQLRRLAQRVSELTREADAGQNPAVVAVWPRGGRCGLALYRPIDLDKLAESNYLQLRFSRELHWTALLTAVDLIKHHARMLWRLVESQLTAAPLEARYQLMRRLAGESALTGRHAGQLRALSAPEAVFLTIQQADEADNGSGEAGEPRAADDPIVNYCVRLSALDRSTTAIERRNPVTRSRLSRVLSEIDEIGSEVDAPVERTLEQLCRCGSLLGDDVLYGISDHLAEIGTSGDRDVHLVLQMPRELMRYPWELLRDRHGWLVERFAIGRQIIADADATARWASSRRNGPLRLLVVAPSLESEGVELAGVGVLEGTHVASCFERLEQRLPGLVEPADFHEFIGQPVTVERFRALIRERRYDIVHFAGHGRYDAARPERSCWMFTDGPLYAFELRHTLANAEVAPWLVYGSACEGARDGQPAGSAYHDGVYGMASAALGQGVAAYIGPLWKISETDAKNLAAAFYEALLLRRTSLGEALALARRCVRDGEADIDDVVTAAQRRRPGATTVAAPRSAGWTGMVLYGDPTPTVMQRLSPSDAGAGAPASGSPLRSGRAEEPRPGLAPT